MDITSDFCFSNSSALMLSDESTRKAMSTASRHVGFSIGSGEDNVYTVISKSCSVGHNGGGLKKKNLSLQH